jgi:hypothetical protein
MGELYRLRKNQEKETADLSTALRSGRDDKFAAKVGVLAMETS